ncbi:hypothetical protein D3C75_690840 [compost metagenome]
MAQGVFGIPLRHQWEKAGMVGVHFHADNKRRKGCHPDNASVQQDIADFAVEQALLGGTGLLLHNRRVLGIHTQGQGRQSVRHQIDPQNMDRPQWRRPAEQNRQEQRDNLSQITGQQEQNRFLDVPVNIPSFLYCFDNGRKIIVGKHHIRGALGYIRAGNAHGHANIRLLQGRSVVDPVAGHGDDVAPLPQGADNLHLMLGGNPGKYPQLVDPSGQLLLGDPVQFHP